MIVLKAVSEASIGQVQVALSGPADDSFSHQLFHRELIRTRLRTTQGEINPEGKPRLHIVKLLHLIDPERVQDHQLHRGTGLRRRRQTSRHSSLRILDLSCVNVVVDGRTDVRCDCLNVRVEKCHLLTHFLPEHSRFFLGLFQFSFQLQQVAKLHRLEERERVKHHREPEECAFEECRWWCRYTPGLQHIEPAECSRQQPCTDTKHPWRHRYGGIPDRRWLRLVPALHDGRRLFVFRHPLNMARVCARREVGPNMLRRRDCGTILVTRWIH